MYNESRYFISTGNCHFKEKSLELEQLNWNLLATSLEPLNQECKYCVFVRIRSKAKGTFK